MNKKNSVIMFASGIVALACGAVTIYVEQRWNMITAGLCFLGGLSLALCLVRQGAAYPRHLILSRCRNVGIVLLVSVLTIVFFVGLNYGAAKLPWRWDVTRAKQHTLSPNTIAFIQKLKQNVRFSALYVGIPPTYLEDLFQEYARASNGKIKTEIIDPIQQIGYAAQFGNIINGKQNKVVVRSGKERRDVDFTSSALSEEQLTDAVARVTRSERHLYFLTGHGEYSLTDKGDTGLVTLSKLLGDNNFTSRELMLGIDGKVPSDCDVLVVAGPHQELTEKEENAIEQYLKQGGAALFLIENTVVTTPDKPLTEEELHKNPALNHILNQWGVNVEEDLVVDLASHAGDDVGCPATRNYGAHKDLTEGLDYTFYVRPRMITVLPDRRPTIKLAPIVWTASKTKSWAETNRTLKVAFDPSVDTPGPIPLAFVIMEEKGATAKSDTRIIVFTDADFLTNIYINQYSNAQMGLNVINWLAESAPAVYINSKQIKVERLDLTSKQRRAVAAILFLMPVAIAAAGIIVWMKR